MLNTVNLPGSVSKSLFPGMKLSLQQVLVDLLLFWNSYIPLRKIEQNIYHWGVGIWKEIANWVLKKEFPTPSVVHLTLWTRRAGLAAYANRGPETRRAGFPAFAMVCQKLEEYLNRRT